MVPGSLIFNEAGGFTPLSNSTTDNDFFSLSLFIIQSSIPQYLLGFTCFPNYYYYIVVPVLFTADACLAHIPFLIELLR